ncbi:hypothetical protein Y032_0940g3140 [Ancylostoma ceylanicum]|uniref:Uncharacterized protein n=1 Tax=Ancylostoma ceylanicum TaxID=53326 RepID=A0A016W8X7_9BILA|nr:hypothetical protein Y032_0940g3140 [Ancylostoma ceylanicum]
MPLARLRGRILFHVDAEKLSLLSHPLVLALLNYKWNSLGRYVYYLALTIYVVFLCFLTLFIIYTPAPFNVFNETHKGMVDHSPLLSDANATCPHIVGFSVIFI